MEVAGQFHKSKERNIKAAQMFMPTDIPRKRHNSRRMERESEMIERQRGERGDVPNRIICKKGWGYRKIQDKDERQKMGEGG